MESEEIRELRATLLRLKQEHRDLDSAINALEESGRADALQLTLRFELGEKIAQVGVAHRTNTGATIPANTAAPIQWL